MLLLLLYRIDVNGDVNGDDVFQNFYIQFLSNGYFSRCYNIVVKSSVFVIYVVWQLANIKCKCKKKQK